MPWNNGFFEAAQKVISEVAEMDEADRAQAEKERSRALDDLLRADPSDGKKFKGAIRRNRAFWQRFGSLQGVEDDIDDDAFLEVPGDPSGTTSKQIHQEAAKQRVLLGLQGAEEEVLVAILANNSDQCRAYLAQKSNFGPLARAPGWQEDMAAPQPGVPKTINVLPNEAINAIQAEAARLLLLKKIEQAKDSEQLEALRDAPDSGSFEDAATALGFPDGPESLAALGSYYDLYEDDALIGNLLDEQINKLKLEAARTKYEEMVKGWTQEEILAQRATLEQSDEDFRDQLDSDVGHFTEDEDVQWAKGIAGKRFLEAYLPANKNSADLLTVINAGTVDDTVSEVKALMLPAADQIYIDHAITEESLASFKTSMVQGVLAQYSDSRKIKSVVDAKDLNTFKAALKGIGVTQVDWITDDAQMVEIQKAARTRNFELAIGETSKLGAGAHSQLIKAFKALEPEKQAKILENNNNEMRHLVNAQDTVSLRHYLGDLKPATLLTDVVNQNKKAALFKGIHNAVVAKLLMNFEPSIDLDATKVAEINKALNTHGKPPAAFATAGPYKNLVDHIKTQCDVDDDDERIFYNAFGLNDDGSALSRPPKGIANQQKYNEKLLDFHNNPPLPPASPRGEHHTKFIEILLSIKKSSVLTDAERDQIKKAFRSSSDLSEFIDKVAQIKPGDKVFVTGLTNEFTSTMYNEIKAGVRKRNISSADPEKATEALDKLEGEFENLQKGQKGLDMKEEHAKFLKVQPIHLFNPTFKEHARTEAATEKVKYQETAEECAGILDKLRRDRWALQGYLDSLPTGHTDTKVAKKIADLRSRIEAERNQVDERIDFYKKVQDKLIGKDGILAACDEAIKGEKSYYTTGLGIKVTRYTIGDVNNTKKTLSDTPLVSGTAASTSGGTVLPFLVERKLKSNEAVDYEISYGTKKRIPGGGTADAVSVGCYTETHPNSEPGIVTSKDGKVSKAYPSRFEMKQFPQPGAGQEDADVASARVAFSMDMAKSVLASMDGPPSKDNKIYLSGSNKEELRYLWTALVIIGEKDPNMQFDRSAIDTSFSAFNPKSERTTTFKISHYASDSLYKTEFKNHEDIVDQKLQHIQTISQDKLGHKKEASEQAEKSAKSMKSSYQDIVKNHPDTLKKEGAAPQVEEVEDDENAPPSIPLSSPT